MWESFHPGSVNNPAELHQGHNTMRVRRHASPAHLLTGQPHGITKTFPPPSYTRWYDSSTRGNSHNHSSQNITLFAVSLQLFVTQCSHEQPAVITFKSHTHKQLTQPPETINNATVDKACTHTTQETVAGRSCGDVVRPKSSNNSLSESYSDLASLLLGLD